MKYLLLFFSMSLAIIGQIFLKKGVLQSSLSFKLESITKVLLSPYVLIGFLSYGLSSIIWLFVLQKFPLSVAYPALSLTYLIIIFLGLIFFNEPITLLKIFGISFILLGVFFIFK